MSTAEYLALAALVVDVIALPFGVYAIWVGVNTGLSDGLYAKGAFYLALGLVLLS